MPEPSAGFRRVLSARPCRSGAAAHRGPGPPGAARDGVVRGTSPGWWG